MLRPPLPDAGLFAGQVAEIVQLGTPDLTAAFDLDLGNIGAVERENAFYAFAVRDPAHGDGFRDSGAFAGNDGPGKNLDTFLAAFLDPVMDADGIADIKIRMRILLYLLLFDFIYRVHKSLLLLELFKER